MAAENSRRRLPWWIRWACAAFRAGQVPRHVAFIMDGNRRYARHLGVDLRAGHVAGFEKLEEVLEWCLELGVEAVTVFAFSIDNFRRPAAEVDALMGLARAKFAHFQTQESLVQRFEMRLQIVGDLELVPPDVQLEMDRAVNLTSGHAGPLLNVCFAYTAQHELLHAARALAAATRAGELDADAIDEAAISRAMPTGLAPDGQQARARARGGAHSCLALARWRGRPATERPHVRVAIAPRAGPARRPARAHVRRAEALQLSALAGRGVPPGLRRRAPRSAPRAAFFSTARPPPHALTNFATFLPGSRTCMQVLWPALSAWSFFSVLIRFQLSVAAAGASREGAATACGQSSSVSAAVPVEPRPAAASAACRQSTEAPVTSRRNS